jgi:hypothetical protein
MLSPTQGRMATLVIGLALLGAACSDDEGNGLENPINPVMLPDASAPRADAAIEAATPGSLGGSDAGSVLDTGVTNPRPDATTPTNDAAMDTGVVPTPEGGTSDAMVSGSDAGDGGVAPVGDGGGSTGSCCPDGKCLCHGPAPTALTSNRGPYKTASYTIAGTGCVFYPTDAEPPFAAVTISDGFLGAGGCGSFQTGQWAPLYASWGIVAMIVDTGSSDQPNQRGRALLEGIQAFKAENTKSGSPLNGKLAGRYGTSGFSMGGGGTSYASRDDKSLLTSVAIMPWGPVTSGVTTPTLVICGSSDGTAPCSSHGNGLYRGIANTVPKMRVQVSSGHQGQPSAGGGRSGQYGLAFQKVFLEGDLRWRPLLVAAQSEETNIK